MKLNGAKLKRSRGAREVADSRRASAGGRCTGAIRVRSWPSTMKRPLGVPELQVQSQAVAPGVGKSEIERSPELTSSCFT